MDKFIRNPKYMISTEKDLTELFLFNKNILIYNYKCSYLRKILKDNNVKYYLPYFCKRNTRQYHKTSLIWLIQRNMCDTYEELLKEVGNIFII